MEIFNVGKIPFEGNTSKTPLAFLRKYVLDKEFKLNIGANHATLAQHTFQHELRGDKRKQCFRLH